MKSTLILILAIVTYLPIMAQSEGDKYQIIMRETENGDLVQDSILIETDQNVDISEKEGYQEIWVEDDDGSLRRGLVKKEEPVKVQYKIIMREDEHGDLHVDSVRVDENGKMIVDD